MESGPWWLLAISLLRLPTTAGGCWDSCPPLSQSPGGCLEEPPVLRKQEPHQGRQPCPGCSWALTGCWIHFSKRVNWLSPLLSAGERTGFELLPCHLGAVRPGANDLNSPRLSVLRELGITFNLLQLLRGMLVQMHQRTGLGLVRCPDYSCCGELVRRNHGDHSDETPEVTSA